MPEKNTLLVSAIKNGTVIDHIASGSAIKILRLLDLASHKKLVTLGLNLKSRRSKFKDLIKVEDRELTPEEANRVALFSPEATINIIKNYQVIKKMKTEMPATIGKLFVCPNPKCISNNDPMDSLFAVKHNGDKEVKLKCHYCEKIFHRDDIKEYKI